MKEIVDLKNSNNLNDKDVETDELYTTLDIHDASTMNLMTSNMMTKNPSQIVIGNKVLTDQEKIAYLFGNATPFHGVNV